VPLATYHVGDAFGGDAGSLGLPRAGARADGHDEEVVDAGRAGELAPVVEHVRDGGGRGVAQRAADGADPRGAVHGRDLHHAPGPGRARGGAHVPQPEVVRGALRGVGAREEERRPRRQVVARDQHGAHRVAEREVAERPAEGSRRGGGGGGGGKRAAAVRQPQQPEPPRETMAARAAEEERQRVLSAEHGRPAREQQRRQHASRAGPRRHVEEVGQPRGGASGAPPQRGLQPHQRGAGQQPVGRARPAVDGQHAHLARAGGGGGGREEAAAARADGVAAEQELGLQQGEDLVGQAARRRVDVVVLALLAVRRRFFHGCSDPLSLDLRQAGRWGAVRARAHLLGATADCPQPTARLL
jgi:hypothetical protein